MYCPSIAEPLVTAIRQSRSEAHQSTEATSCKSVRFQTYYRINNKFPGVTGKLDMSAAEHLDPQAVKATFALLEQGTSGNFWDHVDADVSWTVKVAIQLLLCVPTGSSVMT